MSNSSDLRFNKKKLLQVKEWVVDTSAIINMPPELLQDPNLRFHTTETALEELRSGTARAKRFTVEALEDRVTISSCTDQSLNLIEEKQDSIQAGYSLSKADSSLLALALDLNAGLLTDDYMMQNIASLLQIPVMAISTRGIRKKRTYYWLCTGCGKRYSERQPDCEVCGSPLKREIKRASSKKR